MRHLTIRNVPAELAKALEEEKQRRGASLNQTVLDLLRRTLGIGPAESIDNGLGRYAGGWSDDELRRFEESTASFEQIDEELWR